jgi:hypothetical protein
MNLISECVNYGSPFLALQQGFFSPAELREWLAHGKDSEEKTMWNTKDLTAYKALCCYEDPHDQYCEDGTHLLMHRPLLGCLFIRLGGDLEIAASKDEDANPLYIELAEKISNMAQDIQEKTDLMCILGPRHIPREVVNSHLDLLLRARHYRKTPEMNDLKMAPHLLQADWIEKITPTPLLPQHLLERCQYLQDYAPQYWERIQPLYKSVVEKLWREHACKAATRECLEKLNTLFPHIIETSILKLSDPHFTISLLPLPEQAYLLGLPIHLQEFKPTEIEATLAHFSQTPLDDYLQQVAAYNKTLMERVAPPLPPWLSSSRLPALGNETDLTFVTAIEDYSPFDIYYYVCEGHLFRFVRFEFDNILKTGKNPWTNKPLPAWVLSEIQGRVKSAAEWNFSPSLPLKEIYEKIQAGDYFISAEDTLSHAEEDEDEDPAEDLMSFLAAAFLMRGESLFTRELSSAANNTQDSPHETEESD